MCRRFIDKGIVKEIGKKRRAIASDRSRLVIPDFVIHNFHERAVRRDALLHSFKIEYPNGNGNGNNTHYNTHRSRRKLKRGVECLRDALRWGWENFDSSNINEDYIKQVAGKVDPEFHQGRPAVYRNPTPSNLLGGVRPAGASWTPPYPAKIPDEMAKFCQNLGNLFDREDLGSVLEAAAYAHLHLVRIHPFTDTNGRTARTIQNVILKYSGLPPPVIYVGERVSYYSMLDRAIIDWRVREGGSVLDSDSKGEEAFYNYIAGKVSASLDQILN